MGTLSCFFQPIYNIIIVTFLSRSSISLITSCPVNIKRQLSTRETQSARCAETILHCFKISYQGVIITMHPWFDKPFNRASAIRFTSLAINGWYCWIETGRFFFYLVSINFKGWNIGFLRPGLHYGPKLKRYQNWNNFGKNLNLILPTNLGKPR